MIFDAAKIIPGLVLLTAVVTLPAWYDSAFGDSGTEPDLGPKPAASGCILPVSQMRANHMTLLHEWRDQVVRGGQRVAHTVDGRAVPMSLTNGCLGCHGNRAQFCDRCHAYAAVKPDCFECHLGARPPTGERHARAALRIGGPPALGVP